MWQYNSTDELCHYGVLGMRWGILRSNRRQASNASLARKAANHDIKSAKLNRTSEKHHSKKDLGASNKMAKKSSQYSVKASKLEKAANRTDSDFKKAMLTKRSESMAYRSTKAKMKANRISKTRGYGVKAMRYSIKSDKVALKAAAARKKIAGNKAYTALVNRKISSLTKEELSGAYSFINDMK